MNIFGFVKKLAFLMLALMVPMATYAQVFTDVPPYHKYSDAIESLSNEGVVGGYSDGSFKPETTINRAEFTKIVVESLFTDSEINNCLTEHTMPTWSYIYFPDVPYSSWFAKYVCVAAINGVIKGYPDGNFKPSQNINLAEGLKVVLEASGTDTTRTRFSEHPLLYVKSSDWFSRYFAYARGKKIINPDKFYHPGQLMARGEMADLLYRLGIVMDGYEPITPDQPYSAEYTLTIPKLNIVNLNVSFADPYNAKSALEVLKYGLGHYLSPPGEGQKLVIFGHSSGYNWDSSAYKQVLRQIDKLSAGDRIYINYHEKGHAYQIHNKEIMPANNLGIVMNDHGYEELALYTCWPPDSISHRYVIYATPVST